MCFQLNFAWLDTVPLILGVPYSQPICPVLPYTDIRFDMLDGPPNRGPSFSASQPHDHTNPPVVGHEGQSSALEATPTNVSRTPGVYVWVVITPRE